MKLSQDQIQELYNFTRRRLVEHYGLQTELVDHLANGIEKQWEQNTDIDFDAALRAEFEKFGHFGFRNILKRRKKAMNKKYNRIIWSFYKAYFRWPKIAGMLIGSLTMFMVLRHLSTEYKWLMVSLAILPIAGYFMYIAFKRQKEYHAKIGIEKRWMLQEKIYTIGGAGAATLNFFHIFNTFAIFGFLRDNPIFDAVASLAMISCFTLCYVIIFILPNEAEKILSQQYPEYKLVSKKWR